MESFSPHKNLALPLIDTTPLLFSTVPSAPLQYLEHNRDTVMFAE